MSMMWSKLTVVFLLREKTIYNDVYEKPTVLEIS